MLPNAEFVHWWFATGFLIIGVVLLAEAIVGEEVWRRRIWRAYLWPSFLFVMGLLMWPVMTFYTNSTIHLLAHRSVAHAVEFAGAGGAARGGGRGLRRAGLAALAARAGALAHGSVGARAPSYRGRVRAAPGAVRLRFDQPVTAEPNAIQVKNQLGKTVSRRSRS